MHENARKVGGPVVITDGYEEVPPDPVAAIESLRSLGYDLPEAVADIIDNSIAAGATTVDVTVNADEDPWVAVTDDGSGMDDDMLREAMRVGSKDPLITRGADDLGRFGFGLKTASFSQCRELTVWTRTPEGTTADRCWDLDHTRRVGRWELGRATADALRIIRKVPPATHGTVVLWRHLEHIEASHDRRGDADRLLLARIDHVAEHLALVFHRYLDKRAHPLSLRVNGRPLRPRPPFDPSTTKTRGIEPVDVAGHRVVIEPFIASRPGAGSRPPKAGLHIYRRDRLIVTHGWLGLPVGDTQGSRRVHLVLDMPVELDHLFQIDIRKTRATIPDELRQALTRIAHRCTELATEQPARRGSSRVTTRVPRTVTHAWESPSRRGGHFKVNRDHPAVTALRSRLGGDADLLDDLLSVLEAALPSERIDRGTAALLAAEDLPAVADAARHLVDCLTGTGVDRDDAIRQVLRTEPFHLHPGLPALLGRGA